MSESDRTGRPLDSQNDLPEHGTISQEMLVEALKIFQRTKASRKVDKDDRGLSGGKKDL